MRLAILTDAHANLPALRAALAVVDGPFAETKELVAVALDQPAAASSHAANAISCVVASSTTPPTSATNTSICPASRL